MFIRNCFLNLHWSESWIGLTCEITHRLLYYELKENSQRNINLMQNALIQIISFFPTDELFWKYTNWFYQLQFSFRYYGRETEARLWWIKKWRGQLLAYITIITNIWPPWKLPEYSVSDDTTHLKNLSMIASFILLDRLFNIQFF